MSSLQAAAHQAVAVAVRNGDLPHPTTQECACGAAAEVYDHRDYRKPLDVTPACRSCNGKRGAASWGRSVPSRNLAAILSHNTASRMFARYGMGRSYSAQLRALAADAGVGYATVQRIIDPVTHGSFGTTLGVIEKLAKALRCETFELLRPQP